MLTAKGPIWQLFDAPHPPVVKRGTTPFCDAARVLLAERTDPTTDRQSAT
jgi:hypothetical protein